MLFRSPEDLGGSIALSSVAVNGSRVIGPIVVVALANAGVTTPGMFYINAATYLFVVFALLRITLVPHQTPDDKGWKSFTLGIRTARERPVVGRILLSMSSFSLVSLTFVGLFPAVAKLTFHIAPKTLTYKWLYATWGFGSMLGALAADTNRARIGCLVFCSQYRNIGVLAKGVISVDHISGGRFEMGLGSGWHDQEARAFGVDWPTQGGRFKVMESQLQALEKWRRGERVTQSSPGVELADASMVPGPMGPMPIWIGASASAGGLSVTAMRAPKCFL